MAVFPSDYQSIIVVLLAIVPGFVATTFWSRAKTWKGRNSDLATILQSLAISAVIQLCVAPLTVHWFYRGRHALDQHPLHVAAWLALVVLVIPILGGSAIGRLTDLFFNPLSPSVTGTFHRMVAWILPPAPAPSMWDWLFRAKLIDGCFIVIQFTDGTRVAGIFGKGSQAYTSPEPQALFLAQEWALDDRGNLIAPIPGSKGVMIASSSNIKTVRILQDTPPAQGASGGSTTSP